VFNVKDFGAEASGSGLLLSSRYGTLAAAVADYPLVTGLALTDTIDYAAIQSAINTMWATPLRGGTVFLPSGAYVVNKGIDIGSHQIGSGNTTGRIVGVGRTSFISGNLPNDFIFYQNNHINGPEEISNLAISNTSTWIGSGGIRISNSTAVLDNLRVSGMIAYLFPWNIYNASLNNCTGSCPSDTTTGYNGTLGFAGFTPNIKGWRSTSPMLAGIQVAGSNSSHIDGCGIENCVTAILLGAYTGWASHCTVVPDGANPGFSILTVGGTMGSGDATGAGENPEFNYGMTLFGRGLALPAWGSDPYDTTGGTTITLNLTGSGSQGTYQINGNYNITTPFPIWTLSSGLCAGITVSSIQSEACFHTIYLNSVSGCHISGVGCGSNPVECPTKFGPTGLTPRAVFYLKTASATTLSACSSGGVAATTLGGIYIAPTANTQSVTIENCIGRKGEDNITTGSITGAVMTTTAWASGASLGVGMTVTGTGVAANTVITGSLATEPLTETVTITIASPGVVTRTAHGLAANTPIMLYNSGNSGEHLPTGLASRTLYYVKTVVDANNFTLSATSGGTVINTSGTQSGTHYLDRLNGSTGLSGYNTTGTWRVSPGGQSVAAGTTLTVRTAPDWVMPTATESKTALKFVNCSSINPAGVTTGLNNFNMTFTSLPEEAGSKSGFSRQEGQEYNIVDGAKLGGGTAAIGDATQGGGTQHIKVWWNGTNWIRFG